MVHVRPPAWTLSAHKYKTATGLINVRTDRDPTFAPKRNCLADNTIVYPAFSHFGNRVFEPDNIRLKRIPTATLLDHGIAGDNEAGPRSL